MSVSKNVSYEKLADVALNAALEVRRSNKGESPSTPALTELVRLLRDPVHPEVGYKLLTDIRNISVYRKAWQSTFGDQQDKLKSDVFIRNLSDFLSHCTEVVQRHNTKEVQNVYLFCLALNRYFLEKSAHRLLQSRSAMLHERP